MQASLDPTEPYPFGIAAGTGPDVFVATEAGVAVERVQGLQLTDVRNIPLAGGTSLGETLTADGRYLLVGAGSGAAVVSVRRAEDSGTSHEHAVLGYLRARSIESVGPFAVGQPAIEAVATRHGHYAFLSMEYPGSVQVFDLRRALASRFAADRPIATVRLGDAVVGTALSPNGRYLFATSEQGGPGGSVAGQEGTLSVIDVARAVSGRPGAVVAVVPAGCQPVRVALSDGGQLAWVTARGSDELLAYSVPELLRAPSRALVAEVRVGSAPVGLSVVDGGREVVVADSNRFVGGSAPRFLSVVSVPAALAGSPALLGGVPTGHFPREIAVDAGLGVLLVTDYQSAEVQVVALESLPRPRP